MNESKHWLLWFTPMVLKPLTWSLVWKWVWTLVWKRQHAIEINSSFPCSTEWMTASYCCLPQSDLFICLVRFTAAGLWLLPLFVLFLRTISCRSHCSLVPGALCCWMPPDILVWCASVVWTTSHQPPLAFSCALLKLHAYTTSWFSTAGVTFINRQLSGFFFF